MPILPSAPRQRRVAGTTADLTVTPQTQFAAGGQALAEGFSAIGQTLERARAEAAQLQTQLKAKNDRTASINALTQMDQQLQKDMTGKGGLLTRQGLNARGVTEEGINLYDNIGIKGLEVLENDAQRSMTLDIWNKRRRYAVKALGGHEFAEGEKAQEASEDGFIANEANRMMIYAHDDATVLDASRNVTDTAIAKAERRGLDTEATEALVRDITSPIRRNWLMERSKDDPNGAREIFESEGFQVLMHEADRIAVKDQLESDTDIAVTQEVARRMRDLPLSGKEKALIIDKEASLTPSQKDEAKRRIFDDEAIDRQADKDLRAQSVKDITSRAMTTIDRQIASGAGAADIQATFDEARRNLPDVSSRNNLEDWLEITVRGKAVQTDWALFNDKWSMTDEDWQRSGEDPNDFSSQLAPDELKELIKRKASMRRGALPEDQQTTQAKLNTYFSFVGWGTTRTHKKKKGLLTRVVNSRISALESLKNREATSAEKDDIIWRSTQDIQTTSTFFGFNVTSKIKRFDETPEDHIQRLDPAMRVMAADAAARNTGLPNVNPRAVSSYAAALVRNREATINAMPQHKRAAARKRADEEMRDRATAILESGNLSQQMLDLIGGSE